MKKLSQRPHLPQLPLISFNSHRERSSSQYLLTGVASSIDGSDDEKANTFSPTKSRTSTFFQTAMSTRKNSLLNSQPSSPLIPAQSSSTLRKIASIEKRIAKGDKFDLLKSVSELKTTLGKYKQDAQYLFPVRKDVKKTIQCLELLNETDSTMSEIMESITKILKSSIYINPKLLENYKDSLSKSDNEELSIKILLRNLNCLEKLTMNCEMSYVPYYSLCSILLTEFSVYDSKRFEAKSNYESHIKDLNELLEQKEQRVTQLKAELENSVPKTIYDQTAEDLKKLREAHNVYVEENKQLKIQNKGLTEENTNLLKTNDEDSNENEKLLQKVEENQKDIIRMNSENLESLKKINHAKEKFTTLQESFDSVVTKLEDIKSKISTLQNKNDELSSENKRLKTNMSMNGQDDLTPRPDYKTLQGENKINLDIYDSAGKNQVVPTTRLIEELIKKVTHLTNKNADGSPKSYNRTVSLLINNKTPRNSQTGTNLGTLPVRQLDSGSRLTRKSSMSKASPRGSFAVPSNGSPVSNMRPRMSQFYGTTLSPTNKMAQVFGNNSNSNISTSRDKVSPKSRNESIDSNDDSTPSNGCNSNDGSPSEAKQAFSKKSGDSRFSIQLEILKNKDNKFTADVIDSTEELIRYVLLTKDITVF